MASAEKKPAEKKPVENGIGREEFGGEEDGIVHRDVKPETVFQDSQTGRFRDSVGKEEGNGGEVGGEERNRGEVGGEERNRGEVGGDERNGEEREDQTEKKSAETNETFDQKFFRISFTFFWVLDEHHSSESFGGEIAPSLRASHLFLLLIYFLLSLIYWF
ncbi:hypothetical protein ACOSP7_027053 [Xanthoceras sorbifolium]